MLPRIITTLLILLGLGGAGYGVVKYQSAPPPIPANSAVIVNEAWIEVVRGTVFNKIPGQAVELKSGDAIKTGVSLETGKNSEAIVHFPDGSVLRLDKETSITLSELSFKTADHSLIVNIGLTVGRVWSKVVGLATPESSWEVKTSNAVATVRGTAFGMGYRKGTSWVLGSEHTISVAALDPDTKERIKTSEIILDETKAVQISDKDAEFASATTSTTTLAQKINDADKDPISKESWIRAEKEADKQFDLKIKEIKDKAKDDKVVREEIRKENLNARDKYTGGKEKEPTTPSASKDAVAPAKSSETKTDISNTKSGTTNSATSTANLAGEISIVASQRQDSITEGDTVKFQAILTNNGQKQDATTLVRWSVIGSIGSIKAGIFTAKLGDDVSENGKAVGYVVASYLDRKDIAKSNLITVTAKLPDVPVDIGGQ